MSNWLTEDDLVNMIERWGKGYFEREDTLRLVSDHRSLRAAISQLEAERDRLRAALEPFAQCSQDCEAAPDCIHFAARDALRESAEERP